MAAEEADNRSDGGKRGNAGLPKIWFSRILQSANVIVGLKYSLNGDPLAYKNAFQRYAPVDPASAPTHLYFDRQTREIPKDCSDAFKIYDGLLIVSQKFRDVLAGFNLGQTQFFRVPIYRDLSLSEEPRDGELPGGLADESRGVALSEYAPHYVLHIAESRPCFVPEASQNVQRRVWWGHSEPAPDAPWVTHDLNDALAVSARSVQDIDLWADASLQQRFFLSDRLKRAIDAAGVTQKGLNPISAHVLP